MRSGLNILFEEDIEMQDAIEDITTFVDDADDLQIGVAEDRYKDESAHLFTSNEVIDKLILDESVEKLLSEELDEVHMSDEDIDELFDDIDDIEDDEIDI